MCSFNHERVYFCFVMFAAVFCEDTNWCFGVHVVTYEAQLIYSCQCDTFILMSWNITCMQDESNCGHIRFVIKFTPTMLNTQLYCVFRHYYFFLHLLLYVPSKTIIKYEKNGHICLWRLLIVSINLKCVGPSDAFRWCWHTALSFLLKWTFWETGSEVSSSSIFFYCGNEAWKEETLVFWWVCSPTTTILEGSGD